MKHYSRVHETDSHYVLRDSRDGKMFHVSKKGIDDEVHKTIKSLAMYNNDQPSNANIPGTDSQPLAKQPQKKINPRYQGDSVDQRLQQDQPQAYAEGGQVDDAIPAASTPQAKAAPVAASPISKVPSTSTGGDTASPTKTSTETGGSSPGGASTGGVGSGIGGAGTGGAATGGASTGGAGTVNVTISGSSGTSGGSGGGSGREAPITINISNVGGRTEAGEVESGDGPGSAGTGGKGDGSGGGGGGAAPSEPSDMSSPGKKKVSPLDDSPISYFDEGGAVDATKENNPAILKVIHQLMPKPSPSPTPHYEGGAVRHYDEGTTNITPTESPLTDPNFPTQEPVSMSNEPIERQEEEAAAEAAAGPAPVTPEIAKAEASDNTVPEGAPPAAGQQPVETPQNAPATSAAPSSAGAPQSAQKAVSADTIPEKAASGQSTLQQDLAANDAQYQKLLKDQQTSDARYSKLVSDAKLDPSRFYSNQNLGQKISMGLGLILGGMSSGLTGQENPVLDMLNKNIDRDIEAQKNDQSNKINLWKMNHEALHDQQAATLQTRNQILEHAKIKMDELMGTAPGPMAQQKAAALKTQIQAEQMQNQFAITRSKLMQSLFSEQNSAGGSGAKSALSGRDPASLVPYVVPQEQQKQVLQEIQDRQNITTNGPKIMAAFDQANKDLEAGSFNLNPASVDSLHQLMLPLFKDIDGTVRQAAMDESFKNLTPKRTDFTENRVKTRRQALQDWVTSKAAAPNAKAYGIDLDKYQSTAQQMGGTTFKQNGVLYQRLPDGSAKRVR